MLNIKPKIWRQRLIAFVLLFGVTVSSFAITPFVNSVPEFALGAIVHFPRHSGQLDSVYQLYSQSGFNTFRDEFEWAWIEREKGRYHLDGQDLSGPLEIFNSESAKIDSYPLFLLDYGNPLYWRTDTEDLSNPDVFARFTNGFIEYTRFMMKSMPNVRMFEVWNEWNINAHLCDSGCPKNIDDINQGSFYGQFLKKVSAFIKEERPEAVVLSQGLAYGKKSGGPDNRFLIDSLNVGSVEYLDGVALHPYMFLDTGPERVYSYLVSTRRQLYKEVPDYKFRPLPFYITEMGWPTSQGTGYGHNITELQQSNLIERFSLLVKTLSYVKGLWLYDLVDDGLDETDNENNFGLVHTNLTTKPAFEMVSCLSAPIIKGTEFQLLSGSFDPEIDPMKAYSWQPSVLNYGVSFFHHEEGLAETAYSAFWVADGTHKKIRISVDAASPVTISYSKGFCASKLTAKLAVGGSVVLDVDDSPLYVSIPASQGKLSFQFLN